MFLLAPPLSSRVIRGEDLQAAATVMTTICDVPGVRIHDLGIVIAAIIVEGMKGSSLILFSSCDETDDEGDLVGAGARAV